MLSLFKIAFHLELLRKMLVSVLQEIFPELCHKSDHIIVLLSFLVHVDRKIWLIG